MLKGTGCAVCEKGRFKDWSGIETCSLCDDHISGSTTKGVSVVSADHCTCLSGTFLSQDSKQCEEITVDGVDATENMTLATRLNSGGRTRTQLT